MLGSAMLCSGSWPALWYFALRLGLVGFVESRYGSSGGQRQVALS